MRKIVFTGLVLGTAMILSVGTAGAQGTGSDYPPCSRGVTDKCVQTHEGMGSGAMGDHGMGHHRWHHHGGRHHHHGRWHHHHHGKHHKK